MNEISLDRLISSAAALRPSLREAIIMQRYFEILLLALIVMLVLGGTQRASAETRFGVYLGAPAYNYALAPPYASPYYGQQYAAPYEAYGYGEPRWRDDNWRREREHREHEWRERERREHERREHHYRDRW
jgi:hypothetical protein